MAKVNKKAFIENGGKMKIFKIILLMGLMAMFLFGCGGSKGYNGVKKLYQPDWWQVQDSDEYVQTFGMATKASRNISYDAAYSNAMLQAAQYVQAYVKGMVKNFEQEAGVTNPQVLALTSKVVKVIADAKFNNSMVTKQETILTQDNRYQTFVRVSILKDAINKKLANQIKNEEALYNEFKATQAFKELDGEINK